MTLVTFRQFSESTMWHLPSIPVLNAALRIASVSSSNLNNHHFILSVFILSPFYARKAMQVTRKFHSEREVGVCKIQVHYIIY